MPGSRSSTPGAGTGFAKDHAGMEKVTHFNWAKKPQVVVDTRFLSGFRHGRVSLNVEDIARPTSVSRSTMKLCLAGMSPLPHDSGPSCAAKNLSHVPGTA